MTGFVYAIENKRGLVKIGWSLAPERRLGELTVGNPDGLRLLGKAKGSRDHEKEAHLLLARWRVAGEWFSNEGAVSAFVSRLQAPPCTNDSEPSSVSGYVFRPIVDVWRSIGELAADVGESYVTVQQWHWRDSIPPAHFPKIVKAAQARAIEHPDERQRAAFSKITIEHLFDLAERRAKAKTAAA